MTPGPSADTHPLDQYRDPSDAAFVRDLAAEVAAHYGGEFTRMRRANGYSNATWVGDGIAVRVAHTPVDMAREAALVRALPREVGHPAILGEGTAEGHGWIVTAEVHGQNLHEAWPTLTPAEQQQAVRQLWARARLVHDASPSLRAHVASHGGFVPATLGRCHRGSWTRRRCARTVQCPAVAAPRSHRGLLPGCAPRRAVCQPRRLRLDERPMGRRGHRPAGL